MIVANDRSPLGFVKLCFIQIEIAIEIDFYSNAPQNQDVGLKPGFLGKPGFAGLNL